MGVVIVGLGIGVVHRGQSGLLDSIYQYTMSIL